MADGALPGSHRMLSGVAALARLPLLQRARDTAIGRNTSGYASGYRGSPLGTLDMEIERLAGEWRAQGLHFRPGLNEDIAATAVWGSQSAHQLPGARYEGVFGLWYGKGPGVDRAGDVLKHANMAGTARWGGVLALCGDDHGAKSSTAAHQSEQALSAAMIPVLAPASVQELIEYGLAGWALSRWSGCWAALVCSTDTVEQSALVDLGAPGLTLPDASLAPAPELVSIRPAFTPLDDERRLLREKLPAAQHFARLAKLDRVVVHASKPRFSLITVGKAHQDTMEALDLLGLDAVACDAIGLAVYKIGLSWPVEPEGARVFLRGQEEALVIEEKRAFVEEQLARILYNMPDRERPRLGGKQTPDGLPCLPADGELSPRLIAEVLSARLGTLGLHAPRALSARVSDLQAVSLARAPHYCAGCPHNTSTKVDDSELAFGGIGCHGMAMWMPDRPTRKAVQMGGEGANWLGQAPFVDTPHAFQNLGDGTYFHSGSLAIRATVAAGVNLTYKILYNEAVAMTGGQAVDGSLSVGDLARQLKAEGVRDVVVVASDLSLARDLPRDVTLEPREALNDVKGRLARTAGVTAIIYVQPCAAELRRKRKAKEAPDPAVRVFIHEDVCEGCGDCAKQSNCVAIVPVETALGRKRAVDQSACNKDLSCVRGFCPSFVVVEGGDYRGEVVEAAALDVSGIPDPPPRKLTDAFSVLVCGVGGTGVVSLGQLLTRAAALENTAAISLDVTGLSQKNGAVFSHVRFAASQSALHGGRIGDGAADLILACDLVVAASAVGRSTIKATHSVVVHEREVAPTAQIFADPDMTFSTSAMIDALSRAGARLSGIEAQKLARRVLGDAIYANSVLLGAAVQLGHVPVSWLALQAATKQQKRGAEETLRALNLGRLAVADPARVAALLPKVETPLRDAPLDELIERCQKLLTTYQDERYASRFARVVQEAVAAERRVGREGFARAVAYSLWRLMSYKDEYEVARLYSRSPQLARMRAQFGGAPKVSVYLAPPGLARRDAVTGELQKRKLGSWVLTAFQMLCRLRGIRGKWFDPFGWQEERRIERSLIEQFEADMAVLSRGLSLANYGSAVKAAESSLAVRGFGRVKMANIAKARTLREEALASWHGTEASGA